MRNDTRIFRREKGSQRYELHNGLTVSVVWHELAYSEKDAEGNVLSVEMACFDTHSDDEMEMVWRTREVWDGAGGDDVLSRVPQEREVELVNQAEEWERWDGASGSDVLSRVPPRRGISYT